MTITQLHHRAAEIRRALTEGRTAADLAAQYGTTDRQMKNFITNNRIRYQLPFQQERIHWTVELKEWVIGMWRNGYSGPRIARRVALRTNITITPGALLDDIHRWTGGAIRGTTQNL